MYFPFLSKFSGLYPKAFKSASIVDSLTLSLPDQT